MVRQGLMIKAIAILLLLTVSGFSWAQSDRANSLLNQLIEEVKLKTNNSRQVKIETSIPWDTSEYVFKTYLSHFDTTNYNDISNTSKPTRRQIIWFSKLVTEEDYHAFREQVVRQNANRVNTHEKTRTSTRKTVFNFSQPLVSINGKVAIVKKAVRHRSGGGRGESITVYLWSEGKWTQSRCLEQWWVSH